MTQRLDLKFPIKRISPEPVRVAKGNQVLCDPSEEDYHERRQKSVSQEVQHRRKHWNRETDHISQRDRTFTKKPFHCQANICRLRGILHLNICLSRQVVAAVLCELWTRKKCRQLQTRLTHEKRWAGTSQPQNDTAGKYHCGAAVHIERMSVQLVECLCGVRRQGKERSEN